jgi:hypothetical protein
MKVKYIFSLLTVLFLASCITDYGNYEYQDLDTVLPVSISGMKDTSITKGEYLVIDPEVTISGDQSNYTYSWYVMPAVAAGALPVKTVWSNTKKLNQQVTLAVGKYLLNLTVIDSIRDIYVRKEVTLDVKATEVGAGWFVLKDVDDETDFDYINGTGVVYSDVLLTLVEPAGSRLKGKAVRIEYQPARYFHQEIDVDGKIKTLSNQSVYHILSDEDIKVISSKDLKLFKNQQDIFYSPTVCRPQNLRYANANLFLINGGKVSSIYGMMPNVGKFAYQKAGFYTFHKDLLIHAGGGAMGFDLDSRTFYHVDAYFDIAKFRTGPVSTTEMNATLINMLTGTEGTISASNKAHGFAVMKNLDKEEYYLATLNYNSTNAYPIAASEGDPDRVAFDTISANSKFPAAPVKAAPYSGNFVYFAEGNKLSVYRNASGLTVKESLLKEFPADETISYIANVYKSGLFNYLGVLTNSSNGWKLYAFNITGLGNPEFDDTPAFVRQGVGNARFFIYRS